MPTLDPLDALRQLDPDAIRQRMDELDSQREAIMGELETYSKVLDILERLHGRSGDVARAEIPTPGPSGARQDSATARRLIVETMRRRPDAEWSVDDLRADLRAGGHDSDRWSTKLRVHLYTLKNQDKVVWVRTGVYRLPSRHVETSAADTAREMEDIQDGDARVVPVAPANAGPDGGVMALRPASVQAGEDR